MTRQHAAEFKKMATQFKKDIIAEEWTPEDVMRWLHDERNVGRRFGWTLMKVGYEGKAGELLPTQTGGPE